MDLGIVLGPTSVRSMHPYRELPTVAARVSKPMLEELILYGLLVVIGAIPVVMALAQGHSFAVDATVGLLMMCGGALGAIAYALRMRRSRTEP